MAPAAVFKQKHTYTYVSGMVGRTARLVRSSLIHTHIHTYAQTYMAPAAVLKQKHTYTYVSGMVGVTAWLVKTSSVHAHIRIYIHTYIHIHKHRDAHENIQDCFQLEIIHSQHTHATAHNLKHHTKHLTSSSCSICKSLYMCIIWAYKWHAHTRTI
jgi:hypothetical protein